MTIGELIDYLSTLDKSMLVGTVGHFGEFHMMDIYDFSVSSSYIEWNKTIKVLNIETPYIGEEPD